MKPKVIFFTMLCLMISGQMLMAQKVTLKKGDLGFLKGVKKVALKYEYDEMAIGKYKSGKEYIEKKKSEYNAKEAGKGDKWEKDWIDDRSTRFEPKFEELLAENFDLIDFGQNNKSEYTMVVKTMFTEPGYNIEIVRKNASIDLLIDFIDMSGKVLATVEMLKVPGRDAIGFDYDTGYRIEEAYAKAGKSLGRFLERELN